MATSKHDYDGCEMCERKRKAAGAREKMHVQFRPSSPLNIQAHVNGVYAGSLSFAYKEHADAWLAFVDGLQEGTALSEAFKVETSYKITGKLTEDEIRAKLQSRAVNAEQHSPGAVKAVTENPLW